MTQNTDTLVTTPAEQPASPLRRRGLIAGAAALAATLLAKQASDTPVLATDGLGIVVGPNTYTTATTSLASTTATSTIPGFRVVSNLVPTPDTSVDAIQGYAKGASNSGVLGRNDDLNAIGTTGVASNGTGLYGQSGSGTAVGGSTTSGAGVYGLSVSGNGVQGAFGTPPATFPAGNGVFGSSTSTTGNGVYGVSTVGLYGVRGDSGTAPGAAGLIGVANNAAAIAFGSVITGGATIAGYFNGNTVVASAGAISPGNLSVAGSLFVNGTKAAVIKDRTGGLRTVYCVEAPESWLEDFGTGSVVNGVASVSVDPEFMGIVQTGAYEVFLTEYDGNHGLYVTNRSASGFEVHTASGSGSASFAWRLVVKRSDVKAERLAKYSFPFFDLKLPELQGVASGTAPLPPQKANGSGGGQVPTGQGPVNPSPAPLPVVPQATGPGVTPSGVAPAPIPPRRP